VEALLQILTGERLLVEELAPRAALRSAATRPQSTAEAGL
jgi:hypothetical protein